MLTASLHPAHSQLLGRVDEKPQRHAPHVLHQPEPEHRREGPQLADGERCHLLERGGEGADVLRVEASSEWGMRPIARS